MAVSVDEGSFAAETDCARRRAMFAEELMPRKRVIAEIQCPGFKGGAFEVDDRKAYCELKKVAKEAVLGRGCTITLKASTKAALPKQPMLFEKEEPAQKALFGACTWERSKKYGFTHYRCGDAVIHEARMSVRKRAGWGHRAGVRTERRWLVRIAGKPVGPEKGYRLLRDAKAAVAERRRR
jgi:hypothetical protein